MVSYTKPHVYWHMSCNITMVRRCICQIYAMEEVYVDHINYNPRSVGLKVYKPLNTSRWFTAYVHQIRLQIFM